MDQDLLTPNEIKNVWDLGGKTPLIMRGARVDDKSIELPLSLPPRTVPAVISIGFSPHHPRMAGGGVLFYTAYKIILIV